VATVLPRANLNEQVYATLRTRILAREHGPGEKLSLHELAAELGVSRSPVHHALTRLVSEGRLALELHAADVTVETAEDERISELGARLDATAAAISHEEWDAANAAFHELQVDLAGNQLLSRFYRELSVNLMMQVIRGGHLEQGEYLVTEHRAIVDALEARDRESARAAITRHVETGRRIALEAIERAGGSL
jgi:DNA-binding GntR family transcriptional regulator